MAEATEPCPSCQQPIEIGTAFCPHCGQPVATAGGPAASPGRKKKLAARTMLGVASDLGIPGPPGQPVAQPAAVPSAPGPAQAPVADVGPPGRSTQTDMSPRAAAPQAAAQPASPALAGRTMLGVAPGLSDDVRAAVEAARKQTPAKAPADFNPQHTLNGMSSNPPPSPSSSPPSGLRASQFGGRTMLGVPEAGSGARGGTLITSRGGVAEGEPSPPAAPAMGEDPGRYTASSVPAPPTSGGSKLWLVLAVLVAGAAVGAFFLLGEPEPLNVDISVVEGPDGEAMAFRVPDSKPGAKIVFGKQERPLVGGEARFPLAVDSLKVGENLVVASLVDASGESQAIQIPLNVDFRIHADTAPLHSGKPSIDLVVSAVPGTKVTVDGDPLPLDERGRGIRTYTVDVVEQARSGSIEHVVKYRIEPPKGEAVVDELRTIIPVTMMQLDSPGFEVITDRASIQVAGAVAKGTRVSLDGQPINVNAQGRFLHQLPLPKPGEYRPNLVAQAPDRAPLGVTLRITRVTDLGQAADGFDADPDLTYAVISQNPAMYKGQKVAFEGRVFRAKTEGGRSVLQMLVRECPRGMQCSLWVTYPATTDVMADSWVRVLGTADGVQQFRAQSNEIVSVPKVNASIVLPIKP